MLSFLFAPPAAFAATYFLRHSGTLDTLAGAVSAGALAAGLLMVPMGVLLFFLWDEALSLVDLGRVAQVVGDYGVHIGQRESRVHLHDGFRCCAAAKGTNHQFKQHSGPAYADCAISVLAQGRRFWFQCQRHMSPLEFYHVATVPAPSGRVIALPAAAPGWRARSACLLLLSRGR